jgi:hypothetical protein
MRNVTRVRFGYAAEIMLLVAANFPATFIVPPASAVLTADFNLFIDAPQFKKSNA